MREKKLNSLLKDRVEISEYASEPISKRPLLYDICVPDERDLRFASTGSNFGILVTRSEASALTFSAILEYSMYPCLPRGSGRSY